MSPVQSKFKKKATVVALLCLVRKERKHRFWSRQMFIERDHFSNRKLKEHLELNDEELYKNFFRMDKTQFEFLLEKITPYIAKQDTQLRASIPPKEKLQATLRFLAAGNSYEDLKFSTCISAQTLGRAIPETCQAIYEALKNDCFKFPRTEQDWRNIARDFDATWNFPNCLGSIDGKHVAIECPKNSGSEFFNYKKFYSIVLLGVVNANYEFIFVDVGMNGRAGDGGIFQETVLYNTLLDGSLKIPQPESPPNGIGKLPYTFVADDAFALSPFLMKPFSHDTQSFEEKIFNYRLSRARRVVENAFGILSYRFRVLKTTIGLEPSKVEKIVLACCTLHNFLRQRCKHLYTPPGFVDFENVETGESFPGTWRKSPNDQLISLMKTPTKKNKDIVKLKRNRFKNYFVHEGKVSWQNECIGYI